MKPLIDMKRFLSILAILLLANGCATIGDQNHYYVCAYDTVWEAAIDTLKAYSITSQDKDKGLIETVWIEMEGKERGFGVFGRDAFGNRERARLTAKVTQHNDVASMSVVETRQRWHARGGASTQATKWWPVDPSKEVLQDVAGRLNTKLSEKGCHVS
jgi:hypothetical protein